MGIIAFNGRGEANVSDIMILLLYIGKDKTHSMGVGHDYTNLVKDNLEVNEFLSINKIKPSTSYVGSARKSPGVRYKDIMHAHPSMYGSNLTVSCGFVTYEEHIKKEYLVDTHRDGHYALHVGIENDGINGVMENVYNTAYFAVAWLDDDTKTLNLYRYNEDLYYGKKNGGTYVSSSKDGLEAIECVNIQMLDNMRKYTIRDGRITKLKTEIKPLRTHTTAPVHSFKAKTSSKPTTTPIKIDAYDAPSSAKSILLEGVKRYYWVEDKVLYVESIISYRDSTLEEYDLTDDIELTDVSRKYTKIVNIVNKELL